MKLPAHFQTACPAFVVSAVPVYCLPIVRAAHRCIALACPRPCSTCRLQSPTPSTSAGSESISLSLPRRARVARYLERRMVEAIRIRFLSFYEKLAQQTSRRGRPASVKPQAGSPNQTGGKAGPPVQGPSSGKCEGDPLSRIPDTAQLPKSGHRVVHWRSSSA